MCFDPVSATILAGAQIGAGLYGAQQQQQEYQRAQDQYQRQLQSAQGEIKQREGQSVGALQQAGEQAQAQFSPYSLAGKQALEMYKGALGMPGGTTFNPTASNLYKYQLNMNTDAMNRMLASKGLAGSAAAMPSLARMTTQLGAEEGTRQMGYLQNMITGGQQAVGEQARYGYTTGQNIADVYGQTGRSLADLYGKSAQGYSELGGQLSNVAGATSQGIQSSLGNLGQNLMYQPFLQASTANQLTQAKSWGSNPASTAATSSPYAYNFGLNAVPQLSVNYKTKPYWGSQNVGGW